MFYVEKIEEDMDFGCEETPDPEMAEDQAQLRRQRLDSIGDNAADFIELDITPPDDIAD